MSADAVVCPAVRPACFTSGSRAGRPLCFADQKRGMEKEIRRHEESIG
jgi:hypothetical protein